MTERLLRIVAILIAVVAIVDPRFSVERRTRPRVALHGGPGAEERGDRVAAALESRFEVVPAPISDAAARIVVGGIAPPAAELPGFVVTDEDGSVETIVRIRAPRRAPLHGRVPVEVELSRRPDEAGDAVVELHVGGLLAARRTVSSTPAGDGAATTVNMSFIPATTGSHHLRVTVGGNHIDTAVYVDERPWQVLVRDPRPSWSSTFVRRTLERDPRFDLAARVATSPVTSVESGESGAPVGPIDAEAFGAAEVVIVGGPDVLQEGEVEALGGFMRRRGGSVILLIDDAPGAAADLAGVDGWEQRASPTPAPLVGEGGESWLLASEVAIARGLPRGARTLAGLGGLSTIEPVVWQRPVGRGLLVVSGALDAWRFRDDATRFDDFWRGVVAAAAAAVPPPVDVIIEPRVAAPGALVSVDVALRDIVLRAASGAGLEATDSLAGEQASRLPGRVNARLEGGPSLQAVRLFPGSPGRFRGRVRLPAQSGAYRLVVEASGTRAEAALIVLPDAAPTPRSPTRLLEAWAAAHGGGVFTDSRIGELAGALDAAIDPQMEVVELRPMESGWWILPFALALGGEWWLRRRRGAR